MGRETEKMAHKFKKAGYRIAYKTTNKTEPVSYTHLIYQETVDIVRSDISCKLLS